MGGGRVECPCGIRGGGGHGLVLRITPVHSPYADTSASAASALNDLRVLRCLGLLVVTSVMGGVLFGVPQL